jgi:hypothetical protein
VILKVKFETFEEMKNYQMEEYYNTSGLTESKKDILKELDELRKVLSKKVRKPNDDEKIK